MEEKTTLAEVIQAEKEIQKCLETEKSKAIEWLDNVKRVCKEELSAAEAGAREALAASREQARREAEETAKTVIGDSARKAAQLDAFDDGFLINLIRKDLHRILPG